MTFVRKCSDILCLLSYCVTQSISLKKAWGSCSHLNAIVEMKQSVSVISASHLKEKFITCGCWKIFKDNVERENMSNIVNICLVNE